MYSGEIYFKYSSGRVRLPVLQELIFRVRAGFAIVVNDLANRTSGSGQHLGPLTLAEATEYDRRLTEWYERLPAALSAKSIILPPHIHVQ
jgi:hypothetical protein